MNLNNIRIVKSAIDDTIYAGYISKDGTTWKQKKDVTSDFLAAVIARWNGYEEIITSSDGKQYFIRVLECEERK